MKKRANNKRAPFRTSPDYVDETRVFNKTIHFTRMGGQERTRGLPTIIYYKDTTTFNNNKEKRLNLNSEMRSVG